MTTIDETTSSRRDAREQSGSRMAAATPTRGRRRPALIGLGVALVIIGGLAAWYLVQATSNTVTVLTVKTSIARGQEVTAADLGTIEVAGGQNTDAITAKQSPRAIGKIALVDLPKGSLVTPRAIGTTIAVKKGESIVGVALTPAQLPSYPLAAGDQVRIVETPVAQGEPPATTPGTYKATVFTTRTDQKSGQTIVDLVVQESRAADVAARAATGRVALIVDAGDK